MSSGSSPLHTSSLRAILAGLILAFLASCTIVKNAPPGQNFVFKTNIQVIGNFSKEERNELESALETQLDDSLKVRSLEKLAWQVMKRPPVFDSMNAVNSIVYLRALLKSRGYFYDSIYFTHELKPPRKLFPKENHYHRTVVTFYVKPGKLTTLDSISYTLRHPELQRLTDSTQADAFIQKNTPFAKAPISAELDRLTELFRNNGYLRFSRDELIGVWDTLDAAILDPGFDPFAQFELLERLQKRREKPTADLNIRLRAYDSAKLTRFYVGQISVYPDYSFELKTSRDSIRVPMQTDTVEGIRVVQARERPKFKPHIFPPYISLLSDSVYRQNRYLRTISKFNNLGTWRIVSVEEKPRPGTDTVDFDIKLTPAAKYSFSTNLEGSINQSVISGNLFGVGVNLGLQNRNFARGANIANTNLRYGIELGATGSNQFIQTQQFSLSHTIVFPRFVPMISLIPDNRRDNFRTLFNFNAANTERRLLYNLTSFNGSWGYEYTWRGRNSINSKLLNIKLPNFEYSTLTQRDSLKNLIIANPALRNIFTDGFIASVIGNLTIPGGRGNKLNKLVFNVEESGLLTGMIRNSFLDEELYRFIKADVEFAHLTRFRRSSVAMRFFAGIGYEFNSTRNPLKRANLPFFKQYFSGGPNSMRAWALRRLGPGSTIKAFDGEGSTPDRYGDVQLEANAEYRFPIGRPFGIKVNGAFFTDIGNVWYLKTADGRPAEEVFKLSRLGTDIAIGAGGGLRIDFDFFVIRLEYSYKVKDPSPSLADAQYQNRWFSYPFFKGSQFQLGINYPFIF